jgi:hypothetical protein
MKNIDLNNREQVMNLLSAVVSNSSIMGSLPIKGRGIINKVYPTVKEDYDGGYPILNNAVPMLKYIAQHR